MHQKYFHHVKISNMSHAESKFTLDQGKNIRIKLRL
jgi:hypothetical protein